MLRRHTRVTDRRRWYAPGVTKLLAVVAVLAACSVPPATRPAPAPPPAPAPVASPPATPEPAPPVAQRFSDGDLGYRFNEPDRKAKLVAAATKVDAAVADEMARQHLPGLAL